MGETLKYFSDVFKNFGVGLMVSSFILRVSRDIPEEVLTSLLLLGLVNVGLGVILLNIRSRDDGR